MSEFGNFLKKEISRNKLSQNKFAEKVGISSYYVGQMIKGEKRPPSRELQIKIATILNFDENWDEVRKVLSKGDNNYD